MIVTQPTQHQYYQSIDELYPNISSRSVKPLRIIIIRHAERADAVLGSDWSKKSFDRAGRYIRFSEHLPDAYDYKFLFFSQFFVFSK